MFRVLKIISGSVLNLVKHFSCVGGSCLSSLWPWPEPAASSSSQEPRVRNTINQFGHFAAGLVDWHPGFLVPGQDMFYHWAQHSNHPCRATAMCWCRGWVQSRAHLLVAALDLCVILALGSECLDFRRICLHA